jgi:hypothetical protein
MDGSGGHLIAVELGDVSTQHRDVSTGCEKKNYQRQPSSRENIRCPANINVILWYGLEYICEFVKLLHQKNRVLSMSKNIWRWKDTVIVSFSWKTTWCSQEKDYGQDSVIHTVEDRNQYLIADLWWQRSLHRWWWCIQETQVAYGG